MLSKLLVASFLDLISEEHLFSLDLCTSPSLQQVILLLSLIGVLFPFIMVASKTFCVSPGVRLSFTELSLAIASENVFTFTDDTTIIEINK